jgi:hypothetical protein
MIKGFFLIKITTLTFAVHMTRIIKQLSKSNVTNVNSGRITKKEKNLSFITYRILRTIGRYFFSSTRWLRPIVLYKESLKKNLDKDNLNKIEIIDVLGVVFVLNKAIKVYY